MAPSQQETPPPRLGLEVSHVKFTRHQAGSELRVARCSESPLRFGSTPYAETPLDVNRYSTYAIVYLIPFISEEITLIYAAKLRNWAFAEPSSFLSFIDLFICHDISIIYMADCVKSEGRVSC